MAPSATPLQGQVEEPVHDLLVVEPRVAHVALADDGVLGRPGERAVPDGAMIAHCWLAACPLAVFLTKLYVSRLGPMAMS